jgi:hypothetical protein
MSLTVKITISEGHVSEQGQPPTNPTSELLTARKMTLNDLAEAINAALPDLNTQKQHVHNWRNGVSLPSYWTCIRLTAKTEAPDWLKDWAAQNVAEWMERNNPDQPAEDKQQ